MSVISLPDRNEAVRKAVDAAWDYLDIVETMEDLEREMRRPKVREALDGITPDEAFAQIQARRTAAPTPDKSVKQAELETLAASKEEIGSDQAEGVFYARSLPMPIWDRPWMKPIDRVVLVHRLREVGAQVGFTRFESAAPDIEGELDLGVKTRRAGPGDDLVAGLREQGRRHLPAVQFGIPERLDAETGGRQTGYSPETGV